MLHAVDHRFAVACIRQGGQGADNGHVFADGISALSVGIRCVRADRVGIVERDALFRHVCVCVDLPLCTAVSQGMRGYPQPVAIHVKSCTPHTKRLPTVEETQ